MNDDLFGMNIHDIDTTFLRFNNEYLQYPPSRICCICNRHEYPKSDTCTTATWICNDCLQKIRELLKIKSS